MASHLHLVEDDNSSDEEDLFPLTNTGSSVVEPSSGRQYSIVTYSDNELPQNAAATRAVRWLISNVTANSRRGETNYGSQNRTIDLTSSNPGESDGDDDAPSPVIGHLSSNPHRQRLRLVSSESYTSLSEAITHSEISNPGNRRWESQHLVPPADVNSDSSSSTTPTNPVLPNEYPQPVVPSVVNHNDAASQAAFSFPKKTKHHVKRKLSSPSEPCSPKKAKENSRKSNSDDDEELNCPVCFEPWTNSGKHRLVSLRCGHLFGQKCVERWLKDCHRKCPQCNVKAKKSEIRVIYAKKLKAVDTSDLENAIKVADKVKAEKREREMELAKVRMQYEMAMEECSRLKSRVSTLMDTHGTAPCSTSDADTTTQDSRGKFFQPIKTTVITAGGGCRVMDFDKRSVQFAISQPSPHSRFMTGFGVKKLSGLDFKSGYFTMLHQKVIKDLRFNPLCENQLLSASQDGSLRITDMLSNSKVHEYKAGKPVWSCCWDSKDRNIIYAGLSNGSFMQFDLRHTADALSTMENTTSRCPVVSLYHVPPTASDKFQGRGGLFSGTLNGASFWQDITAPVDGSPSLISNFKPTFLPLEPGSSTGLCYNPSTNHCLVTFRPGCSYRRTTHLLGELQSIVVGDNEPRIICNVVESFYGGQTHKMLTRNALHVLPSNGGNEVLVACVGDEPNKRVQIYDANRNKLMQSLPCESGPALDILPVQISDKQILAALTETTLKIFSLG